MGSKKRRVGPASLVQVPGHLNAHGNGPDLESLGRDLEFCEVLRPEALRSVLPSQDLGPSTAEVDERPGHAGAGSGDVVEPAHLVLGQDVERLRSGVPAPVGDLELPLGWQSVPVQPGHHGGLVDVDRARRQWLGAVGRGLEVRDDVHHGVVPALLVLLQDALRRVADGLQASAQASQVQSGGRGAGAAGVPVPPLHVGVLKQWGPLAWSGALRHSIPLGSPPGIVLSAA